LLSALTPRGSRKSASSANTTAAPGLTPGSKQVFVNKTSIADSLFDLLQNEYSVAYKVGKGKHVKVTFFFSRQNFVFFLLGSLG
jgi:hypothetical protein